MTAVTGIDRTLSPVQELLALGFGAQNAMWRGEPDAWLTLRYDRSGRLAAKLYGKVLDLSVAKALTVQAHESVHLLAMAAAFARRPLVVQTADEHGDRHLDVLHPPPLEVHQIPVGLVDAAANADAIRIGLPPAIWSAQRVHWSPTPFPRSKKPKWQRPRENPKPSSPNQSRGSW